MNEEHRLVNEFWEKLCNGGWPHRGHPVCGYFRINGKLGKPELSSSHLDTMARLPVQSETLVQGRAGFGYLG